MHTRYGLTVITRPTFEPVTLAEMRLHLRVAEDQTDEGSLITALITAARESVEKYTGRTLCDTTVEAAFYEDPDWYFDLPKPPVIEVQSIRYSAQTDGTDTLLAADQYTVDTSFGISPRIVPAYGVSWP